MKTKVLFLMIVSVSVAACNSWMDIKPENERLTQEYWQEERDVETTVISCYSRLRGCVEKMIQWGELRADVLQVRSNTSLEESTKLKEQSIDSDNSIVAWDPFYKVINSANAVIQYAQLVLDRDPNFNETKLDQYMAEAKTLRALAYFYLVRTFKEVPLILESYSSDVQVFEKPKATEAEIINQILTDLRWSMKRIKEKHITNEFSSNAWQNKGRATRWLVAALLADVYLWNEQYSECIEVCNLIIGSNQFRLIASNLEIEEYKDDNWFNDIFGSGFSDESIFELYFDYSVSNDLTTWFNTKSGEQRYSFPAELIEEFEEFPRDVRGEYKSYYKETAYTSVWKFVGSQEASIVSALYRGGMDSPNWIIYRLAEIYLMRSEAYAMLNNYTAAAADLNTIKLRARVSAYDASSADQQQLLFELLNERKKEFVGEGKRWYDLLRVAKKQDFSLYKSEVLNLLLNNVSVNERPIYQTRLSNNYSMFLPISKEQITLNKGVLVQNPAYQ